MGDVCFTSRKFRNFINSYDCEAVAMNSIRARFEWFVVGEE